MSEFAVKVVRVDEVSDHPNAERLEMARIGGYRCVVPRGKYTAGALVAYIPESAVLPDPLLDELGMTGSSLLAGAEHNRVKAIRLRGELSQGIVYPARLEWSEGQDVASALGVTKYEPPIPAHLSGQVANVGERNTVRYDIENWKKYPDAIPDGLPVVFTEKIHGTWTMIGVLPEPIPWHGDVVVGSKGLSARGLVFKDVPENAGNLYLRVARALRVAERVRESDRGAGAISLGAAVFVLGESYGVQDLKYGANPGTDAGLGFRVFDVFIGPSRDGEPGAYCDDASLDKWCADIGLPRVPVLYRGPFSQEAMREHTDGRETVSGRDLHIREGIVMRPQIERADDRLPGRRLQLKSVSAAYLLRKGETTEME